MKVLLTGILAFCCFSAANADPSPPGQPAMGPGGAEYRHSAARKTSGGKGSDAFHIFEPSQPTPRSAPVIVFMHGWAAINPAHYGAWISHLVKKGNIVIFPVYQKNLAVPSRAFTPNAIAGIHGAMDELATPGHVKPDWTRVAVVGHSMGACISANLAATAKANGLPTFKAVMCVEPGISDGRTAAGYPLADLSAIPARTLLLTVAGEHDQLVHSHDARRIYRETTGIPGANKDFVMLHTDTHGSPPLLANHLAPLAVAKAAKREIRPQDERPLRERIHRGPITGEMRDLQGMLGLGEDALDYYGTWKLCDALTDAAFYGTNRRFALGNTPEQRFMGKWSDGMPVKELTVTDSP